MASHGLHRGETHFGRKIFRPVGQTVHTRTRSLATQNVVARNSNTHPVPPDTVAATSSGQSPHPPTTTLGVYCTVGVCVPLSARESRARSAARKQGFMAMAATAATLLLGAASALESIPNFRPVSPRLPGIYRCGDLEQASAADVAHLLDGARIRTIIDLRNDDEIAKSRSTASDISSRTVRGCCRRARRPARRSPT